MHLSVGLSRRHPELPVYCSTSPRLLRPVTVFDDQGNSLFSFTREQRITDSGSTNAVAKEIIKRLHELKSSLPVAHPIPAICPR